MLQHLLQHMNTNLEFILANLNSLLTEMNAAYFATDKKLCAFAYFFLQIEQGSH
jgi:hypothetical protein